MGCRLQLMGGRLQLMGGRLQLMGGLNEDTRLLIIKRILLKLIFFRTFRLGNN